MCCTSDSTPCTYVTMAWFSFGPPWDAATVHLGSGMPVSVSVSQSARCSTWWCSSVESTKNFQIMLCCCTLCSETSLTWPCHYSPRSHDVPCATLSSPHSWTDAAHPFFLCGAVLPREWFRLSHTPVTVRRLLHLECGLRVDCLESSILERLTCSLPRVVGRSAVSRCNID